MENTIAVTHEELASVTRVVDIAQAIASAGTVHPAVRKLAQQIVLGLTEMQHFMVTEQE